MATGGLTFARWLQASAVSQATLTAPQHVVLEAAFQFLEQRGRDYFSRRLLSHFLLHAQTGLKVAPIARLLGFSRSAASAQQGLSSKEVVQAAHHRLAGRSHGKLLPRFAGPIAQFLCAHPEATRWDLLDFIQRTWGVSVSRMALHRFLKKYGLDQASHSATLPRPAPADATPSALTEPSADTPPPPCPRVESHATVVEATAATPPTPGPALPPPDFFLPPPSTPAPSCSCPEPSTGWPLPGTASPMTTVRSSAGC
jgi:hypothetical protein